MNRSRSDIWILDSNGEIHKLGFVSYGRLCRFHSVMVKYLMYSGYCLKGHHCYRVVSKLKVLLKKLGNCHQRGSLCPKNAILLVDTMRTEVSAIAITISISVFPSLPIPWVGQSQTNITTYSNSNANPHEASISSIERNRHRNVVSTGSHVVAFPEGNGDWPYCGTSLGT